MSWWEVSDGIIIGDQPADIIRSAFGGYMQARKVAGRQLTPPSDLAGGLGAALRLYEGPQGPALARVVITSAAGERYSSEDAAEQIDPNLVRVLTQAFREMHAAYERSLDRAPSRAELLESLLFILRGKPWLLLDVPQEVRLSQIRAE